MVKVGDKVVVHRAGHGVVVKDMMGGDFVVRLHTGQRLGVKGRNLRVVGPEEETGEIVSRVDGMASAQREDGRDQEENFLVEVEDIPGIPFTPGSMPKKTDEQKSSETNLETESVEEAAKESGSSEQQAGKASEATKG